MSEKISANSVAVVVDRISGGTPNLFFGTALQAKTLNYDGIFARNDIQLVYAGTDPGLGADIVKQEMLLSPSVFSNQNFYQNTLGWDFNTIWKIEDGKDYPVIKTTPLSSEPALYSESVNWKITTVEQGVKIIANSLVAIQVHDLTGRLVYASVIHDEMLIPLQQGVYIINAYEAGRKYAIKVVMNK